MKRETSNWEKDLQECAEILKPFNIEFNTEEIRGRSRHADLNFTRALIAFILKKQKGYSLSRIGGIMQRDHATILNLLGYMKRSQSRDGRYIKIIKSLGAGEKEIAKSGGFLHKSFDELIKKEFVPVFNKYKNLSTNEFLSGMLYWAFTEARKIV